MMKKKRVLIAEDLEGQRELYDRLLRNAPFEVVFAEDGAAAVKMTKEACEQNEMFDLLLLDGAMPFLSGLGAAEQMIAEMPDCLSKIYFLTNLEKDDATLNLRIRMMNLDPRIHILAKNDVILTLQTVIENLLNRTEEEANWHAANKIIS